ncbi:TPA: hypothetical protein EYN98_26240, partial [Candidatus Poribacteria bacterium]|nr:hypothetical protein [Candidatus Poribacteria bacterium]
MVIDEDTVITGSFNFSNNAAKTNDENLLVIEGNRDIAAAYLGEYRQLGGMMDMADQPVSSEVGKAILVLGGGDKQNNKDWRTFSSVAQYVYKVFQKRQFDAEDDIYYLSPEPTQTKGADGQTSLGTLELAITNWAKKQVNPQVPLYIYLLSHNLGDKFLLEKSGNQEKYLS